VSVGQLRDVLEQRLSEVQSLYDQQMTQLSLDARMVSVDNDDRSSSSFVQLFARKFIFETNDSFTKCKTIANLKQ